VKVLGDALGLCAVPPYPLVDQGVFFGKYQHFTMGIPSRQSDHFGKVSSVGDIARNMETEEPRHADGLFYLSPVFGGVCLVYGQISVVRGFDALINPTEFHGVAVFCTLATVRASDHGGKAHRGDFPHFGVTAGNGDFIVVHGVFPFVSMVF